ncbi:MFS transporter [Roseibium sp.]|uniref:MFS transporter n=1 Tax=Roseibium sp. TaxID=1936156 RepID=UPI003A97A16E
MTFRLIGSDELSLLFCVHISDWADLLSYLGFLRDNARWLAGGIVLTTFSGFGQTFFISLSSGHLREAFDLSHGQFGLLYMIATLGSACVLPWVGKSVDVYPAHKVAVFVVLSLAGFCLVMSSVSSVVMLFVAIFGLRLCGQGMMTHTSMTAMARWFSAQRGRAVSFAALGFPVSESLMPSLFVFLAGVIGWRMGWAVAAIALVAIALPASFLALRKERTPTTADARKDEATVASWTRRQVLHDPVFWIASAGILAPPFINTAILFNQVYLVELRGWTMELFASAFVVMAVAAVLSSLTLGSLIDRFSAKTILPFALVPLTGACFVLAFFHQPWAPFLFMALFGLGNGFTATLSGAFWPEIYGTRHIGAIRSVAFALMVFSSAAGPGLMGILLDLDFAFDHQLIGMAIYCVLMTVVLVRIARHVGNR